MHYLHLILCAGFARACLSKQVGAILAVIIFCCLLGFPAYLPWEATARAEATVTDPVRKATFTIGFTTYTINGEEHTMDVVPYLKGGRTYLPVRFAGYALGVEGDNILWDDATGTATLIKGDQKVRFTIGEAAMIVNDTRTYIDAAPEISNGRTMLPFRWIAIAFGAEPDWDAATRTVTITTAGPATPAYSRPTDVQSPDIPDAIERNFSWYYQGRNWSHQIQVPKAAYNYYADLERPPTDDYSVYVTHPLDDAFIASLAEGFGRAAGQEGFSPRQTVNFIAAFVQSLEYIADPGPEIPYEYPKYPLETLVEQRGDCEDTSILLASILEAMGFDVVLIAPPEHMAVGISERSLPGAFFGTYYKYSGRKYYYLETTDPGWFVGELPDEYRAGKAEIFSLVPRPVITHDWNFETTPSGWLELDVTVYNDGTATARDTKIYAALDAGWGLVYDERWSDELDLEPHSTGTYTIYLELPWNTSTCLIVKVFSEGHLQDESVSDWFST